MATEEPNAVNDQVVADTTASESAPEENTESVQAEDDLEAPDVLLDSSEQTEATDSSEPTPAEATETTGEQPQDEKTLSPKSENRFQRLANDNRELRRQIEELQAQQARFATEQDLLNEINPDTGEYYSPQEIERISWQQSREAQAERANQELYELQVQQNQQSIDTEVGRVAEEIPALDPASKDFNQAMFNDYMDLLNDNLLYALPDGRQANRATLVANGINPETQATLVGVNTSPYKLAKFAANSFSSARAQGETLGQARAQKANERMLANADPAASASTGKSGGSLDSLFDRVKDIPLG